MNTELTLLQTNDTHAYFDLHQEVFWDGGEATFRPAGGYARLATLIAQARQARPGAVFWGDSGDTLHGTRPAIEAKGTSVVRVLNAMGLDAITPHWEFAYGPAVVRQRAAELSAPLLAANIYETGRPEANDAELAGALAFPATTVVERGGLRLGIAGLASNIVDKTMPASFSEGLRFTSGQEELPHLIRSLRERERIDLVVVLSHLGFPQDLRLLAGLPADARVDVCLSGHTHNRLHHPVKQGETLVIQSGCHGSFVGWLDLEIERGQHGARVVDFRHRLVEVTPGITPDSDVAAIVREALAPHAALGEVVGETATPLYRALSMESTTDTLLLAALREATGAQLAFSNGWRYGAPVPPGPITLGDLYNMVPMDPPVMTVSLTGGEVTAMLEENLERTFSGDPFAQMGGYLKRVAGLRAFIKLENPAGQRVQAIYIDGRPLDPRQSYTTTYITDQGVGRAYGSDRQDTGLRTVETLRRYLAHHRPAHADLQGTYVIV